MKPQYTNYSKPEYEAPVNEVKEIKTEDTTVVTEEASSEEVSTPEVVLESKRLYGFVNHCENLYVRVAPFKSATAIGTISKGTEVLINEEESSPDFYKILTKAGDDGYCMGAYITLSS